MFDSWRPLMAFEFTIDTHANLIRETWTGHVDLEQFYECARQQWAHPDYRQQMSMISDLRAAEIDISEADLAEFAEFMGKGEAVLRHAIIVKVDTGFHLAKVFEALSESTSPYWESLRVFLDYRNGEVWAKSGLPPHPASAGS
jgi:hypothetical protein